jgi:hypothetical protein
MNNCNILYDLPPENALRKELSKMKAKLEEFVDKFLDLEFVFYVPLQSHPLLVPLLNIAFHVKLPHLSSGLTPLTMIPSMIFLPKPRTRFGESKMVPTNG